MKSSCRKLPGVARLHRGSGHLICFAKAVFSFFSFIVQAIADFLIEDACLLCGRSFGDQYTSSGCLSDIKKGFQGQVGALVAPVRVALVDNHPVCEECSRRFEPAKGPSVLGYCFNDGTVLTKAGDAFNGYSLMLENPGKLPLEAAEHSLPKPIHVIAPWMTNHPVLEMVHLMKYGNYSSLVLPMSECIIRAVERFRCELSPNSVLVPVPMHESERQKRRFDHSFLLARELSRLLGLSLKPGGLRKVRSTRLQSRTSNEDRAENVRGAFTAQGLCGSCVLLVDDLVTTGSTAASCSAALFAGGARSVSVLCFGKAI